MNTHFKILACLGSILILANCSRVVKEEAYLTAEQTPPLQATDSMDLPNSSQQLRIPEVDSSGDLAPDTMPPEKTFAKRRSDDENVIIIDVDGTPTMELFNDTDAWDLMNGDLGLNWLVLDEDEENCQVTLRFYDPVYLEQEDQGFFKRLFNYQGNYIDRSGEYLLTCLKLPQKQQIWLQTTNFEVPSSYVVDDLFEQLFNAATE